LSLSGAKTPKPKVTSLVLVIDPDLHCCVHGSSREGPTNVVAVGAVNAKYKKLRGNWKTSADTNTVAN